MSLLDSFLKPSITAAEIIPSDYEYFQIEELQNLGDKVLKTVQLRGNQLPQDNLEYGGTQRVSKNYYPGHSEPAVQILGPEEKNTIIRGVLKDRTLPSDAYRGASKELAELIDSIRIRGNLCRFTLGEWNRYGFIEDCNFKLISEARVEYEISLAITGFNAPQNAKFLEKTAEIPFDINEELIDAAAALIELDDPNLPFDIGREINSLINQVASAVSEVTTFVDNIIDSVQDVQSSLSRAVGLVNLSIQKANNYLGFAKNFNPLVDFNDSLVNKYGSYSIQASGIRQVSSINEKLVAMKQRLQEIRSNKPLATHIVVNGETLQNISIEYYGVSSNWNRIFEYNALPSTELVSGTILDIPRI